MLPNTIIIYFLSGNWNESVQKPSFKLKAPDRCAQLFDREHFLITDKQTEILGCIPCVMVIFLSTRQAEPIYRPLRALWPMTLTYNPSLARVKVDPHAKNQGPS